MDESHDPLQCVKQLRQTIAADKLSIGFFLGAGCPCAIRVARQGEDGDDPLIPDVKGLTEIIRRKLSASEEHQASFERLVSVLDDDGYADPNVEVLLSRIRSLRDAAGSGEARGLSAESLDGLDRAVCQEIVETENRDLPAEGTPYHSLARLAGSYRIPPTEVFTTNQDLLMEQALESLRVPFFDGFVGSSRPFFDQQAIEDDKLPDRWPLLWKLHGSINWRFNKETRAITRSREMVDGEELLIHPSHRKYDESRRMPYIVMIDRLKSFLRNNKQPVALLVIGHSFSDEHLNATIVESLRANPSAACFALQYGAIVDYQNAAVLARNEANFSLLARDGAIVRRREGNWMARPATERASLGGAFDFAGAADGPAPAEGADGLANNEETDEPRPCRFLLGDFGSFGAFLDEFVMKPPADEV